MSERMEENERRVLYVSLLIIAVLAVALRLTDDQSYSLVAVAFIVVIALGNIAYLYTRPRN